MKNFNYLLLLFFLISILFKAYAYEGRQEHLGRDGPPPAGPYRLGYKELERALKTEKKGKIKKAKIKFESPVFCLTGCAAWNGKGWRRSNHQHGINQLAHGTRIHACIYYCKGCY